MTRLSLPPARSNGVLPGLSPEANGVFYLRTKAEARALEARVRTGVRTRQEFPNGRVAVETTSGDTLETDLIVVGTGAMPDDSLARAAGLNCAEGIIVDDHCLTSDPAIFAAGDCTRFPGPHGPVRLENWRHALEHGAIAGRNAAGGEIAYNVAPSFWSEHTTCTSKG